MQLSAGELRQVAHIAEAVGGVEADLQAEMPQRAIGFETPVELVDCNGEQIGSLVTVGDEWEFEYAS